MRTKSWLHNASVEERAAISASKSAFKDQLEEESPLHHLSLTAAILKPLIREDTMAKAINMACSGDHVRYTIRILLVSIVTTQLRNFKFHITIVLWTIFCICPPQLRLHYGGWWVVPREKVPVWGEGSQISIFW